MIGLSLWNPFQLPVTVEECVAMHLEPSKLLINEHSCRILVLEGFVLVDFLLKLGDGRSHAGEFPKVLS